MARFLLIGLDGAEPSLVERWIAEGRLPALAQLQESGALLRCRSTTPPATFPAWTTCVSGVNPGRHGIVDFTCMRPHAYGIRFVNATDRRAPAIWEILSEAGKRVCVLGVPATYPPDRVNGVMVSGFDSPVATSVDRTFVWPPEEFDSVKDWRFADFQESHIGPGWHEMALSRLLAKIDTKERIAVEQLKREPWDFFMVVFGESDTVAHHFWMFHDPGSPRHEPRLQDAIRTVYERLDRTIATLLEFAGDDVVVGVVSDHGFGGSGTGVVHLNNWLAERGYLRFAPGSDSLLKRLALRLTPERSRGALFRRFKRLATGAESKSRFAGIDWDHTRAWSEELNYFPSIRVNLAGREPRGQVLPEDYDAFCRQLCGELEAWTPVAKAWRRDELYTGPCTDRAPDIIVELALEDGYSHSCLRSRGGSSFRRLERHEYLGGKERGMTGTHRPQGILMLSSPTRARQASLLDVAPTVYDVLGVTAPPLEGRSLLGGDTTGAWHGDHAGVASERVYTPEEEAAVEERLRKLGYFE